MIPKSKFLILLCALLCVINVYIINSYGIYESRVIRLISLIILFFTFLLSKGRTNKNILLFFLLYVIADFLLLKYEIPIINKLNTFFTLGAYFTLIFGVFNKLNFKNLNKLSIFIFLVIVILNVYSIYEILKFVDYDMHDKFQELLLYLYGIVIIILGIVAANYNFSNNLTRSMLFMYAVFSFLLSDISGFLAYYLNLDIFFYPDRVFYLIGLSILVYYSIYTETHPNEMELESDELFK